VLWLLINGTRIDRAGIAAAGAGEPTVASLSGTYAVNPGDYIELQAYQNSGGSLNALAIENTTKLQVEFH
jgi:hypothetical protein